MELSDLKYNYVIIGYGGYYKVGYNDIMSLPNVSYHTSYYSGINSKLKRLLVRLTFSRVVNKFFKYPFSNYVYPIIYPHSFSDNKPICFFFFGLAYYAYQSTYIDYLRRQYKKCKIVIFMQDLVNSKSKEHLDIEKARNVSDLLLSYDMGDCKRYNMLFHPTPMSHVAIQTDSSIEESDVYYCGMAKTRYPVIHQLYRTLTSMGLKCDFNLMKMPEKEKKMEGVNYPEELFSYEENLKHINRTKCIVEIQQDHADGYTPRLWESIIYDKHLLTNNKCVFSSPYYYSEGIHDVLCVNDSSLSALIKKQIVYPQAIKESLSPIHLLNFIDSHL